MDRNSDVERLLLPAEAAAILRTSPESLANMRVARKGPTYVKLGRRVLYPLPAVQAFIAAGVRQS